MWFQKAREKRRLRRRMGWLVRRIEAGTATEADGDEVEHIAARLRELTPAADYYNPFGL